MKKDKKYLIELTQTQLFELMEWHKSHVDKYRKMGVKKNYLRFHENTNLSCYLKDSLGLIKVREAIDAESDLQTCPQENL
jgi:hypothetical protein